MKEQEMEQIGLWISQVIKNIENETLLSKIHKEVKELCSRFPLYQSSPETDSV